MTIKIINKSNHELPSYETIASAGLDLRANTSETIELKPLERCIVGTGLFIELPVGVEAQVRSRSGLAVKNGVCVLNSPGTIDADYRGEIGIILLNLGEHPFVVKRGDRVAQMIINKVYHAHLELSQDLCATERNDGGFGHTVV